MNNQKYEALLIELQSNDVPTIKSAISELIESLPINTRAIIEKSNGTSFSGLSLAGCLNNAYVLSGDWKVTGVIPAPDFMQTFEAPKKSEAEIKAELTPVSFEVAEEEDVHIEGANEQDNEPTEAPKAKRGTKPKVSQ